MPFPRAVPQDPLAVVERRIRAAVYTRLASLVVTAWVSPEPLPFARRREGRKLRLKSGDRWSRAVFDCAWFHFAGTVPAGAAGRDVVLLIDLNGEGCVVDAEGRPLLGLTTVASAFSREHGEPGKRVVPFRAAAAGGEAVELWVEAGANDLFGQRQGEGRLREAAIALCQPQLHALQYDFEVALGLLQLLPAAGARTAALRDALSRAAAALRRYSDEEGATARAILAPLLAPRGALRGGGASAPLTISAIGHAHMDLAWLWPIRETIRKCGRTFATALHLMQRYPGYLFGASQPQQYAWVKERYPELYAGIKERVAEGRWEVQGAMWVEPDTNLPSGESLIRQILHGKRFFREEFGRDPDCAWLPDCFGFSGALPQILTKSGVRYFMTQKLSWNWVTRHPYHTFRWHGIDGSAVLAHFPPEATYNSVANPHSLATAAQNFTETAVSDRALLLFGIGDGGGGPGEEHLERLARAADLTGLPPVVQQPGKAFFDHIAAAGERCPVWSGELYLERHQGTYTTQGRIKQANRRLETALRELEQAAAFALLFAAAPYPHAALDRIWKEALLYQFHDILPGSSITRVYDEAMTRYAALLDETTALTALADAALCRMIDPGGAMRPVVVRNSLCWDRCEWLQIGGAWIEAQVPALGYRVIDAAAPTDFTPPRASRSALENDRLLLRFNPDGSVQSVLDKERGREVLAAGAAGNRLAVYRDRGDAWDIPMDYREDAPEHPRLEAADAVIDGPRAALRQRYRVGRSTVQQEIVLFAGSGRIDFVTTVDWHESERMLRTSFAVAVAAAAATCGIQFGSIRRPTHTDTPADAAKFEVCAHKWVDLSEGDDGVALLSDGKYGHHLRGSLIDLNLLRSPLYPDPQADRGRHRFTYSLFPHGGDHVAGGVARAGEALGAPLRVLAAPPGGGKLPSATSWLGCDEPDVVIETVKAAEDGEGLIVRLYEAAGATTATTLRCGIPLAAAAACNLIEEEPVPLTAGSGGVPLVFTPFEIRTLRLLPGRR